MTRPRTATKILDARGAFKTHPERKREAEPMAAAFNPEPPDYFDELQIAVWHEIINMVPAGVLTSADALQVEGVTTLVAEFRQDTKNFPTAKLNRMFSEMGKLGLNPSGRASLTVDKPKVNEFD